MGAWTLKDCKLRIDERCCHLLKDRSSLWLKHFDQSRVQLPWTMVWLPFVSMVQTHYFLRWSWHEHELLVHNIPNLCTDCWSHGICPICTTTTSTRKTITNKDKGCVSHCGFTISIKKHFKAKEEEEELWKLKYFTMQKNIIFKKSS